MTATFVVNVVACLVLGWLHAARHRVHVHVGHFAAVGFCGGLSTFSTFVAELDGLVASGDRLGAALAPALEIGAGLAAVLLGERLGRAPHGPPP